MRQGLCALCALLKSAAHTFGLLCKLGYTAASIKFCYSRSQLVYRYLRPILDTESLTERLHFFRLALFNKAVEICRIRKIFTVKHSLSHSARIHHNTACCLCYCKRCKGGVFGEGFSERLGKGFCLCIRQRASLSLLYKGSINT